MDLERILQTQGFGSRRQCRALIENGAVSVAGTPCTDAGADFETTQLDFAVAGTAWRYRSLAYAVLHKPAGYECSHAPQHHPSIFSLLPPQLAARGVQCVGRLDQDTTGLLLLSDDGAFVHAYTSPKRKVPKVYRVTTKHPIDAAQLEALRGGVLLHGEALPLAALAAEQQAPTTLALTIMEGKYHQVKRMVAAAGNRVEALHRSAVGGFALPDDLAPGQWRWLESDDLSRLGA